MKTMLHESAVHRHYGGPRAVTSTLARMLGRTPGGVHQLLDGPVGAFAQVERVLHLAVDNGHTAWAATRVERFSRIVRAPAVALTPELQEAAQQADVQEDAAEVVALTRPSVATLDAWIRWLERQLLTTMALLDAARAKRERLAGGR